VSGLLLGLDLTEVGRVNELLDRWGERFLGRVFSIIKQGENLAVVLAMVAAVLLQGFVATPLILLLAGLVYFAFIVASFFSRGGRALLSTQ